MEEALEKWQCPMEKVRYVHATDPRIRLGTPEVRWRMVAEGCLVDEDLPYVYVTYQPSAPLIDGAPYEPTLAYTAGSQVYYKGHFYQANVDVAKNQSPSGSPALWDPVPIPYRWRLALIELTYAYMVRFKAAMSQAENNEYYRAMTHARNVLDNAVNEEQGHIGTLERTAVLSR